MSLKQTLGVIYRVTFKSDFIYDCVESCASILNQRDTNFILNYLYKVDMSLELLTTQLKTHTKKLPPVELWDPPYCGEIDIRIKANGDWFYNETIFKRLSLVKLFASVLIKEVSTEANNEVVDYFLVTPVEKVKIKIDDAPFIITQWQWLDNEASDIEDKTMKVSTNLDDEFMLDSEHPLTVTKEGDLYVTVRRNLLAKVHRNVYYQWVDIAQQVSTEKGTELILSSAGCQFSLGSF